MDFLLDNPLAMMDGPIFLVLYASIIILSSIGIAIARANADKTEQLNIPAIPPVPDPYEIAFLRGGANEAARSVIFSLFQKNIIKIEPDGKKSLITPVLLPGGVQGLAGIEQAAIDWIGAVREAGEVFGKKDGLVERLEPFFAGYRTDLEKRNLLASYESSSQLRRYGRTAAALVLALGAYKVATSIAYGHFNFIFMVVVGVIGAAILAAIGNRPRVTKLGKRYLERLKIAFDGLMFQRHERDPSESPVLQSATFASVDPMLLSVGVFGSGILAGSIYGGYNTAFEKARQHHTGGSGGCGSACGGASCSAGCDGGGSSCGSGCGGGGCGGGCGG